MLSDTLAKPTSSLVAAVVTLSVTIGLSFIVGLKPSIGGGAGRSRIGRCGAVDEVGVRRCNCCAGFLAESRAQAAERAYASASKADQLDRDKDSRRDCSISTYSWSLNI